MSLFQMHMNYATTASAASYASSESDGRISPTGSIHNTSSSMENSSTFGPSTPPSRAQSAYTIGAATTAARGSHNHKANHGKPSSGGDPWKRLRYYSRSSAGAAVGPTTVVSTGSNSRADTPSMGFAVVPVPSFMMCEAAPVPLPSFLMPQAAAAPSSVISACSNMSTAATVHSPLALWALSSRSTQV